MPVGINSTATLILIINKYENYGLVDYVHGYVPNAMLTDAWEDLKRLYKE